MPFSSGTYSLPSGNPVVTGTTISSSTTNTTNSDIATALSTCVLKDGTQTITANLPMASHKLTGLSAGTTAGDSVEYGGSPSFTNLAYTGTLTGSTGILNIGSGQVYKDASGNVGIGTSSPGTKLDVLGGSARIKATSANDGILYIDNSGASQASIVNFGTNGALGAMNIVYGGSSYGVLGGANSLNFYNTTAGPTVFYSSSTERMRIDSSGNLLVGQTSQTTTEKFGTTGSNIVCALTGTHTGNVTTLKIQRYQSDGDGVTFFYGTAQKGYISIASTGTTYNSISDYRLKENVVPMVGALDRVMQLNPVSYVWKDNQKVDEGFIAHEVKNIVPSAVSGEKDELDDEGNPRYQGLDQSRIVSVLTAAIQELKAIIDTQQEQINSLLGK